MESKRKHERRIAVQRFFAGEEPGAICESIGRLRSWLYKWVARYTAADPAWCEEGSRRPLTSPHRTPAEMGEIVELVRLRMPSPLFLTAPQIEDFIAYFGTLKGSK